MIEDKLSNFSFQKCVYQTGGPSHECALRTSSQFQKPKIISRKKAFSMPGNFRPKRLFLSHLEACLFIEENMMYTTWKQVNKQTQQHINFYI